MHHNRRQYVSVCFRVLWERQRGGCVYIVQRRGEDQYMDKQRNRCEHVSVDHMCRRVQIDDGRYMCKVRR